MSTRQHWTARKVADGLTPGAQLAALNTQLVQASAAIRYTLGDLDDVTFTTVALGGIPYATAADTWGILAGQTTTTRKFLRQTGTGSVSAAPAWDTIVAADVPASALTKSDDTNVTLTLGGTPTSALLAAASIAVGWSGTLAPARGGTGVANNAANTLTFTGAYSLGITLTAATAVTFPTSGTLAVTGAAPTAHALIDATGHTASGLTPGHFLKALTATTYGFAAHGLTYSDVGAEASGAVATHAALTTGIHGLAITAGQTLTVTTGGTLGSAAYTASTAYDVAGAAATVQGNLDTHAGLTTTAHGLGASAFHADAYFLLAGATAVDSDKLDGQHGAYYLARALTFASLRG